MTIAGDYIGRVRLGVTIGVAGSQSFVWPDGIPAGTYTADAGADGLITLTATVDGDTLTVAWAATDSRRMIGHPWRVLRDGTWLFGDLYVTEAEPSDDDPTEYTVLDGAVEVTVAMVTPAGEVTADDITIDGDIGILDPDTMRAAVIEACEQNGIDEVTAGYIADAYEALGILDPADLTDVVVNTAHLLARIGAGAALVGVNLGAVTATVADLLNVTETPPTGPEDPDKAVWFRPPGDLRHFVDFRLFPDGPIDGMATNGVGGGDPVAVRSFAAVHPLYGGVPAAVIDGAVRSNGVAVDGPDPTPRTGFTFDGIAPGATGRAEWGHGGYTETDGTFTTYSPTNLGISAPVPEGEIGPHAYLMGVVVGRFDTGLDTTAPGNPVSARMRLIRDDYAAPVTIGSAALPRVPVKGDRFAFTWDGDGNLAGHMNGVEIVSTTDATHDISTFVAVGMVMHQGSVDEYSWENAWYAGVEWFGISDGDEITGDLGPHRWTDDGWQPFGPQARAALDDTLLERIVTGLDTSDGGAIPADLGAMMVTDNGVFTLPALGEADHGRPLTLIVNSSGATIPSLFVPGVGDVTDYELVQNTEVRLRWYGYGEGYWFVTSVAPVTPTSGGGLDETAVQALIDSSTASLVTTGDSRLSDTRTPTDASVTTAKLDAILAARIPTIVRATSDVTRTSAASRADDPELKITGAAANSFHRVEFHLTISGDATADIAVGITGPTGATCSLFMDYFGGAVAAASGVNQSGAHISTPGASGVVAGGVIAAPGLAYRLTGWVQLGSTAGDVTLYWGPTSHGAGTGVTRHAGSYLTHCTA